MLAFGANPNLTTELWFDVVLTNEFSIHKVRESILYTQHPN